MAQLQLSLNGGYGQQNLRWSIALSELRWEHVGGPVTSINAGWRFVGGWKLEVGYERMLFLSGKVYDTDHDETGITYAEQFNAGKGGAGKWNAGLGYEVPVTGRFSITPSVGYGMLHQSFYLYGSNDLNSTYKTKWKGPYGQVLCSIGLTKKLFTNVGFRYDQIQYKASANWNLISAFNHPESFRHTANGYGINAQASMIYRASKTHSIGIKGSYSSWQTGSGVDELYLAAGGMQQTQLNEVLSRSWQVMLEWNISLSLK